MSHEPMNLDDADDCQLRSVALDKTAHPLVAAYAANRYRAAKLRRAGRINEAMLVENVLDSQYDRLPSTLKW